mmetsp:Transcript_28734/g.42229  ORF Transcript_28734/g.42229 Transcript_28734/m.42229 type:complete len:156 (+) Transcript_28734:174-641(+)
MMLSATNSQTRALLGLTVALLLQTASCFSVPLAMSLGSNADQGGSLTRRDALSAVLFATTGQVAALALLQPKRSYEKPGEFVSAASWLAPKTVAADSEVFSEQEAYKFQRRLRKVQDDLGSSDMEKIAEAMGISFKCMASELCSRGPFGFASGYE